MERLGNREAGFTIVEVLVATLVVVIGALAAFGMLSDAVKNTARAKATQVALDLAQQEVEALHSLSNKELALTGVPPHSTDSLSPDYRVNSGQGTFALSREPVATYKKLVRNGGEIEGSSGKVIEGGVVNPGPTPFVNGDVSGTVYRYVVWRNDTACGEKCPTQQDYKQIIVAVKLDTPGNQVAERGYVEVQSNFVDPTDSPKDDPVPNSSGNVVTAQQFYLTDTPCSAAGVTERAGNHRRPPASQHPRHLRERAADGDHPGGARRAPARRPTRPGAGRPDEPAALRLLERHLSGADPGYRQRGADSARRHDRLSLRPDRDGRPRVPGPPLGHRPDDHGLQNDGKGDARVLQPDPERRALHRHRLRLSLRQARNRLPARRRSTRC